MTETPRGVKLSPYDEEFTTQMEIVESIVGEDRDVLRKLTVNN